HARVSHFDASDERPSEVLDRVALVEVAQRWRLCDGAGAGEVDSVAARALLLGDYPAQLCFGRYRSRLGRQRAGGGRRRALCTASRTRESLHRRDEESGWPPVRRLVGSSWIDPFWQVRR